MFFQELILKRAQSSSSDGLTDAAKLSEHPDCICMDERNDSLKEKNLKKSTLLESREFDTKIGPAVGVRIHMINGRQWGYNVAF